MSAGEGTIWLADLPQDWQVDVKQPVQQEAPILFHAHMDVSAVDNIGLLHRITSFLKSVLFRLHYLEHRSFSPFYPPFTAPFHLFQ